MEEFRRLTRLPAYVFNITGELKGSARKRGEDIIDFGMGNPDGATPKHIVDKLIEAAQKTATHRYSLSRGLPRLRKSICDWYKRRYDVDLRGWGEHLDLRHGRLTVATPQGDEPVGSRR